MTEPLQVRLRRSNHRAKKRAVQTFWRDFFRQYFPRKTAPWLASLTQTNVRAAEYLLAGRNGFSGRALKNLLRSEIGPQILDALVGDAQWRARERRQINGFEAFATEFQSSELKRREPVQPLRQ